MVQGGTAGGARLGGGCDARELGRRIAFAFSGGELARLAEELGVAGLVRWDRGPQETAADIVKQFEKGSYGGLATLLAKLNAAKPLIEWPELEVPALDAAPASHAFGAAPPMLSPGYLGAAPTAGALPPAGTPVGPTIPGAPAYVAVPESAGGEAPPPSYGVAPSSQAPFGAAGAGQPPQTAHGAPSPYAAHPASGAWPGTVPAAAPAPSGVNPMILVAVAGMMLAAAVIAYFAGRATNAAPVASATADATARVGAHARRPDGAATHVADAVQRSLASVARTCEIPMGTAEDVFANAYDVCGAPPLGRGPDVPTRPRQPRLGGRDPSSAAPAAADDRRHGPRPAPEPRPAGQPQANGCLRACTANQNSCKSACGAEPNSASAYSGYEKCMGQCITSFSRCRLGCP